MSNPALVTVTTQNGAAVVTRCNPPPFSSKGSGFGTWGAARRR